MCEVCGQSNIFFFHTRGQVDLGLDTILFVKFIIPLSLWHPTCLYSPSNLNGLLQAATVKYLRSIASLVMHVRFFELGECFTIHNNTICEPAVSQIKSEGFAAPPATSYVRPSRITHFRPASRRRPENELKARHVRYIISEYSEETYPVLFQKEMASCVLY
ncbi:unnamed protein product [Lasius platythorax]|uniref:Uncharacterized protein n=1 Tax=Lasius platythorax TaxID=488582 RepID=A0AAV2NSE4_9HYME